MIFCVEDDSNIRELVIYTLETTGFKARGFEDGKEFLEALALETPELILLDIMLPGMDGLELLSKLKASPKNRDIPVIMLTAKGSEYDKVKALDAGADDYVTKPFSPREVAVRVRNMLRRAEKSQENQRLVCAELCIVIEAYEVFVREEMVDLTPRETEVLYYLAKNAGRVLTRNQIMNCVWGYDYCGDTRAVDNQIKRIRQKLPADGVHFEIKAVYGVGYKFEFAL